MTRSTFPRRFRLGGMVFGLGASLAALSVGAVSAPAKVPSGPENIAPLLPGDPLEGGRLFSSKGCIQCHSVYGSGGAGGPDLGRGVLNRPLLEIAGVMWNHTPGMQHEFETRRFTRPEFKPGEMASLLAFLYYLGSFDPPGDPASGLRLFQEKRCVQCHAVQGKGGTVGPDLAVYGQYASPVYLATALWRAGPRMADEMRKRNVPRPVFEANDVADVLAYLRTQANVQKRVYARPGNPRNGAELFVARRCGECHAVRGSGGKVGPDLGVVLKGSMMRIAGTMWNHGPTMWAKLGERKMTVPAFTVDEMSDIVSYLYFFQFIDAPGDPDRGLAVYKEKKCATCHEAEVGGKRVAPRLTGDEKLATTLSVITEMWNHAGLMAERMTEANVAWPTLKGGEMADLIAYLLSVPEK